MLVAAVFLLGCGLLAETVEVFSPDGRPVAGEVGVLVFGGGPTQRFIGANPVNIGTPPRNLKSVAAFVPGLPPMVADRGTSGRIMVRMGPPIEIPLQIWVLCANADCDEALTERHRVRALAFLLQANHLLESENSGVQLKKAGEDWFSDQTTNPASASKRTQFRNFRAGGAQSDCRQSRLALLQAGMFRRDALNLYIVGRVDGLASSGESCLERNISIAASATSWHTRLHELGHNMGLLHTDGERVSGTPLEKNLMFSRSLDRRFLWEGQTFRIFYDIQALRAGFPRLLLDRPGRDCTASGSCPPLGVRIWEDRE